MEPAVTDVVVPLDCLGVAVPLLEGLLDVTKPLAGGIAAALEVELTLEGEVELALALGVGVKGTVTPRPGSLVVCTLAAN